MFDIGWTELLVIGVVALIVVGPKDLPGMFRTLGRFTGKARAMARDFQRSMEAAADEAGVSDITKGLDRAASIGDFGLDDLESAASDIVEPHPDEAPKPKRKTKKTAEAARTSTTRAKAKKPVPRKPAARKAPPRKAPKATT